MEKEVVVGIITALSALGGVVVAQVFSLIQWWFERKHQRRVLLRDKYEELTHHLNEAISWATESSASQSFAELHARSTPMAARRIYSLTLLYFPELKNPAQNFVHYCVSYQHTLIENYSETQPGSAGGQAARNNQTKLEADGQALQQARQELDDAIQRHAPSYAAA